MADLHAQQKQQSYVACQSYAIPTIFRYRRAIEFSLKKYVGQVVKGKAFLTFVQDVQNCLPSTVQYEAVQGSLAELAGVKLTVSTIAKLAWRLAGNLDRLKIYQPVHTWQAQMLYEWVPAQVTRVAFRRGGRRGQEFGHELTFVILAGLPASVLTTQWWSLRKSRFLARFRDTKNHGFAFSPPMRGRAAKVPPYLFLDPRQFARLRCLVLIDPSLCVHQPGFREIGFTSSLHDWNRAVHVRRSRKLPETKCPFDLPDEDPCHTCPIGWDRCRAAVHAQTYVYKPCKACDNPDAPFDPEEDDRFCVVCRDQRVRTGEL